MSEKEIEQITDRAVVKAADEVEKRFIKHTNILDKRFEKRTNILVDKMEKKFEKHTTMLKDNMEKKFERHTNMLKDHMEKKFERHTNNLKDEFERQLGGFKEDIDHKLDAIFEYVKDVPAIKEKQEIMFEQMGAMAEDITIIKQVVKDHEQRITILERK